MNAGHGLREVDASTQFVVDAAAEDATERHWI
jgi:hypothetical protein